MNTQYHKSAAEGRKYQTVRELLVLVVTLPQKQVPEASACGDHECLFII